MEWLGNGENTYTTETLTTGDHWYKLEVTSTFDDGCHARITEPIHIHVLAELDPGSLFPW